LISIAFCDSVIMAVYLPFSVHFYIHHSNQMFTSATPERDSLFWSVYGSVSILVCVTLHAMSVWLTVYLSLYRYLYIIESVKSIRAGPNEPAESKNKLTEFIMFNTKKTILIVFMFCVLFSLPAYLYPAVKRTAYDSNKTQFFPYGGDNNNSTQTSSMAMTNQFVYLIEPSELNTKSNNLILQISFHLQAILGKILPSACLLVLIVLIIRCLSVIRNNRAKLTNFRVKLIEKLF